MCQEIEEIEDRRTGTNMEQQAPHSLVLRELLYGLLGFTGDVFVHHGDGNIAISSDLGWIPEPDK